MDSIDFSVNDKLIVGTSEIYVPLNEAVNVNCEPNGFKIGEEHEGNGHQSHFWKYKWYETYRKCQNSHFDR